MKNIDQTRREFLKMTGKGVLGAAALTVIPATVLPAKAEAPAYPFEYKPLDKEVVRKAGYDGYFNLGGCCAGAFDAIVGEMGRQYGAPYNMIPSSMFANGGTGYGTGNLCGALGGALAAIGVFCEAKESRAIRDELYAWYRTAAFPMYQPEYESITTVANSILCVDSVGIYMKETGYEDADPRRKARCGGLTADVAAKTVELLNIHFGYEEAAPVEEAAAAETALADNEYIGVGTSEIGGEVKVKVTMDGDKIAKIEVLNHNETAGIADPALSGIPEAIVAAQSTSVDAISGATKTSEALIAAVNDALSQVK